MAKEKAIGEKVPLLGRGLLLALLAMPPAALCGGFTIYNISSYSPGRERIAAEDAVELKNRTGVDMALYSLTLHPEGRPAIAKAERYVESFGRFKRELEGTGVRAGVLVQAILGHWQRLDRDVEDWTRTIDSKGAAVRFCPLDPNFAKYITDVFTMIAKQHPAFILTDDDVRGYSHNAECFCERHMAIFNARRGTSYTSAELRAKLAVARQGDPDYVAFLALQRETIEGVLRRGRAAIDAVDPSIPGGICIAGEEHLLCAPMARAMAAKGQTPVMRTATASYMERMTAAAVPLNVCRMLGFAEYYRGWGIDLLCESDTFPHNLWSKSARSFATHLANAAFIGMRGSKAWYVNGHKGTFAVSRNYTDILAENRGLFAAIADEVSGSAWDGLAIPCFTNFPNWHMINNHSEFFMESENAGARTFAVFGMPFQAVRDFDADRTYALASAKEVARLSDDDLRRILSRRALVFRGAAVALSERGLDGLTGVKTRRAKLFFNREHDDALDVDLAFGKSSDDYEFIARDGARILATLGYRPFTGSPQYDPATPSAVLYTNPLGGRVLTLQYHADMLPYQLYSEARRASLLSHVAELRGARLPFAAAHDQDMLMFVRRKADGAWLLLAENLNSDPIRRLSFTVPAGGFAAERLSGDGAWRPVRSERVGDVLSCDVSLGFYEAAVLRLTPAGNTP